MGIPSAPGEDVFFLLITFDFSKLSSSGNPDPSITAFAVARSLVLVAGITPRHGPRHNFSEERGKPELRPLPPEAWALGFQLPP